MGRFYKEQTQQFNCDSGMRENIAGIIPDHPAAGPAVHIVHEGIPSGVGTFKLRDKRPEIEAHFYPPQICPAPITSERKHIPPKFLP